LGSGAGVGFGAGDGFGSGAGAGIGAGVGVIGDLLSPHAAVITSAKIEARMAEGRECMACSFVFLMTTARFRLIAIRCRPRTPE
jgi:hypothetical protein